MGQAKLRGTREQRITAAKEACAKRFGTYRPENVDKKQRKNSKIVERVRTFGNVLEKIGIEFDKYFKL